MKQFQKSKNIYLQRPWLKYYKNVKPNLKYPDCSIVELIMNTAEKYPKNIAYEYFGKKVTYVDFIEQIKRCARSLKVNGIKKGDVVTICTTNTPEGIIMFYAVNMVGATANMIHPLSSENEIKEYLNITKSKMILTIDITYEKVINILKETKLEKIIVMSAGDGMRLFKSFAYWLLQGRKIKVDDIYNENIMTWSDFIDSGFDYKKDYKDYLNSEDTAVILYSGGTTGISKGIMLSNMNFNALALQSHLMADPSKEKDSVLCIMPLFHGFGLGVCIHTPLYVGMKCILIPNFSPKKFPLLIRKHNPNFIAGVPTLYEALIKNLTFKRDSLKNVTSVISGGDILKPELKEKVDKFLEEHGSFAKIRCGYGLTEATGACSLTPTDSCKYGSIGVPFPDTYFKIVAPNTEYEVPFKTEGEICISGPTVMKGYLNNESETKNTLKIHEDGKLWLHTGDMGYIKEDGLIYFSQRLKRIIISSGYNIYPSYIESVLDEHPDILKSTVIGISHPYKQQVAKAFIVLKSGVEKSDAVKRSIKRYCEKNIARYSWPYEYEFRDSIPQTKVGKIAYGELESNEKKI